VISLERSSNPPENGNAIVVAYGIVPPGYAGRKCQWQAVAKNRIDRQFPACRRSHVRQSKPIVPCVSGVGKDCSVNGAEEEGKRAGAALRSEERQAVINIGDGRMVTDKRVRFEPSEQPDRVASEIEAVSCRSGARRAEDASGAFVAPCSGAGGSRRDRGMTWT
jgi:hypothetical protein